jgi:hypothetical protein
MTVAHSAIHKIKFFFAFDAWPTGYDSDDAIIIVLQQLAGFDIKLDS